ncbi:ABC transporter ATP-binding protein [Paenibacillus sp. KQZ6P-2]|uniref:ABC transporter ATP-binding protein n=1 Tax=Paenibacillus mangrovi TaxID=2931978 RepID=A0A9X2B665_9BACL|nr:ABC transporter ATP-binding protein [Paenibacillus mangrovi]
MVAETVIDIQQLSKSYSGHQAVDSLSLQIRRGEIFGLLGPNGAGKSTTILMLLGLTEPDSGNIDVLGMNPTREPIKVKRRVGYLPDDIGFYEDWTGLENLKLTARLNGISNKEAHERAIRLLAEVGLKDAADKKAGAYSRGMRQRLGLADVLIKQPEIIILDEPTLGIDPKGIDELLALISNLSREQGLTVLLSSHQLHQVQQICDRVGLFVSGKLLAEGNLPTLSRLLLTDTPIVITAEMDHVDDDLLNRLAGIEHVNNIQIVNGDNEAFRPSEGHILLQIGCSEDCSSAIAKTFVELGASLFSLQRKQYGLDEIYRRYFAGGDEHGSKRSKKAAK